ncbi:hypothetical protein BMIN_1194 [Bifidobacterium minimum]|uniref:Uncharacterized protein n=1 Tax=Bifidobacterium minimum TaxID=1693 RepID=A0A087BT05_9BIFI|nr:hypothetical protein BMIN_1194 [Bifidobacterium minimum]
MQCFVIIGCNGSEYEGVKAFDDLESLKDHRCVIGEIESVRQLLTHFRRRPKAFVSRSPVCGTPVVLSLCQGVVAVNIDQPTCFDCGLDEDCHATIGRIDQNGALARLRQKSMGLFELDEQTRRRSLVSGQD